MKGSAIKVISSLKEGNLKQYLPNNHKYIDRRFDIWKHFSLWFNAVVHGMKRYAGIQLFHWSVRTFITARIQNNQWNHAPSMLSNGLKHLCKFSFYLQSSGHNLTRQLVAFDKGGKDKNNVMVVHRMKSQEA